MKKINLKPYILKANELKITPFEVNYSISSSTSVSVFNNEVESQEIGNDSSISARGLFNNKLGFYSLDSITKDTINELANGVYQACLYGKDDTKDSFFSGKGAKYKKVKINPKEFKASNLKELREVALNLSKKIQSKDKRITKCEVSLSMIENLSQKENDLGLKCSSTISLFSGYASIVAEEDNEPKSYAIGFNSFKDIDDLVKEAEKKINELVSCAVDFFKTGPVKSKNYPVILSSSVISSLLSYYVSQLSAHDLLQHLSIFEGKLNTQICSKKITLTHTPFKPCSSSSSFDSEGVPTSEFKVIKNGVLLSYFHCLETSKKMNVLDNGCGSGNSTCSPITLTIKESKKSKEEGFSKIKNGLYVFDVSGLNCGIDGQTLEFSLPCSAYQIIDGKKANATSMNIISGNLKDLFNNVKEVYNDVEENNGIFTPSMYISKISVSGK